MSEPIVLTKENFRAELKGAPRLAKMAAGLALKIRYGSLEVQFPDGRRFHIKGQEDGPHGVLKIHNWAFSGWSSKQATLVSEKPSWRGTGRRPT